MTNISDRSKKDLVIEYAKKRAIIRPSDLAKQGLPKDYLYQLAKDKTLKRIGRGLYQWSGYNPGSNQSLLEAIKQAPNTVVSLLSALNFHNITSQNPYEVWLAIDRKAWRPHVAYPPVRYVSMSLGLMEEGIEKHTIDGIELKVFSVARTIVDCFKYRNKIGLEVALVALKEAWLEKRFTMEELAHYSDLCRVRRVMQPYLESLI